MLCNKIAKYNDYLIRGQLEAEGKKTRFAKWADANVGVGTRQFFQGLIARFNGTVVFQVVIGLDFIHQALIAPGTYLKGMFTKDREASKALYAKADETWKQAERCFLGWVSAPISLISPDFVTRHFVPEEKVDGIVKAGGKFHTAKGTEEHPTTIDEVEILVKKAIKDGKKIAISGAHMSQSKDTLPVDENSISINMQKLNKVGINAQEKIAVVQAGATWSDIQNLANKEGLAIQVMQASNIFTVGGALGVNCHGYNHLTGTVAETIRSITIINAQGELQTLRPDYEDDKELFGLVIGGHGLFGVIVEAEIRLIENESLISRGIQISPENYVKYFDEQVMTDESTLMHLYRLSLKPGKLLKEGVAVSYCRKTHSKMVGFGSSALTDERPNGTRLERILLHAARNFQFTRGMYWKKEKANMLQGEKGMRNEIMRPPINAVFNNSRADAEWLQEYFIKKSELAPFLEKMSEILTKNNVALFNASVRHIKKDEITKMAYAKDEDHFSLVLFFNQSLASEEVEKTRKWVCEVIDYLTKDKDGNDLSKEMQKGVFYLPYQQFATEEQFAKCYPQDEIIAMKDKYDKLRTFDNGLYQDYFKPREERLKTEKAETIDIMENIEEKVESETIEEIRTSKPNN